MTGHIDRRQPAVLLLFLALLGGSARSALAQAEPDQTVPAANAASLGPGIDWSQAIPQPAGPPPTPRHTGIKALVKGLGRDVKALPSKENAIWAGVGGALALAVHPVDDNVNKALINSPGAKSFFKAGEYLGELPTLMAGAATTYAVGRIGDKPKISHVGMDLIQSLAISEGITQTLKYTTRRMRPDNTTRNSFPSGHAADTFAFATALERHLGWRYFVPAYVLASYVAVSRMPANRHWLSDAVFGSFVGVIAGRTVTSDEAAHPYPVAVTHVPGGVAVMYTRRSKRP
jgi:membrane-associated phospholipid phosphatase